MFCAMAVVFGCLYRFSASLGKYAFLTQFWAVSVAFFATLQSPQRSFWALRARSWKRKLKMRSRGLPAPGSKKVKIRAEKESKSGNFNSFQLSDSFSTLIVTFWTPGAGRSRELIFNCVSNLGPEGTKTPLGGLKGRKAFCCLCAEFSCPCRIYFRKAPDAFKYLRHVMRAALSVRPNCSHRCVSLKESPKKPV